MSTLPKGPRRLAIFATELQRKYNELLGIVRNSGDLLLTKNKEIEELKDRIGILNQTLWSRERDIEAKNFALDEARADVERFVWWFHNGDNDDDQLRAVKIKRINGEKVTLDEWRAALDGAMRRKQGR